MLLLRSLSWSGVLNFCPRCNVIESPSDNRHFTRLGYYFCNWYVVQWIGRYNHSQVIEITWITRARLGYYTVSHKKRATFLIITLVFLGRFLYFLHQWKDEGILYTGVNKIYHFTLTVSPNYLVNLKRHKNSTFWSQSSQCVRSNRLLATCEEICPMLFF